MLPKTTDDWFFTNLQQRLLKKDVRLINHVRYYRQFLVESHLTRRFVGAMLGRIAALPLPAAWAGGRTEAGLSEERARDAEASKTSGGEVTASSFGAVRRGRMCA